jgi:hypothetical protein
LEDHKLRQAWPTQRVAGQSGHIQLDPVSKQNKTIKGPPGLQIWVIKIGFTFVLLICFTSHAYYSITGYQNGQSDSSILNKSP